MQARRIAVIAGVVAATGLAIWGTSRLLSSGDGARPSYQTGEVRRGDLASKVTATGTLSPVVLVSVGTQVSGTIKELRADFNSHVTSGEIIARLDPRFFESAVAQAQARLAAARADLRRAEAAATNARAQHDRQKTLTGKGIASASDLDAAVAERRSADAQVEVARADILQAQAALRQADVNLAYTTVVSPIDGTVISRNVDVGQTVAASLQSPTLFVIAGDLRRMEVHTSVAESDVGQLREGMAAEFTVDAFPGKRFVGSIKQVRFAATTVQNVVTYDAVIEVANEAMELRPGMTANVTFVLEERKAVLLVPARALRFRPAAAAPAAAARRKDETTVYVLREGVPAKVPVQAGLSDGTSTEVSGPLREGDRVITGDGSRATAGGGNSGGQPRAGAPRMPRVL